MAGIGEQRKRAGPPAADRFGEQREQSQRKCEQQPVLASRGVVVRMRVYGHRADARCLGHSYTIAIRVPQAQIDQVRKRHAAAAEHDQQCMQADRVMPVDEKAARP